MGVSTSGVTKKRVRNPLLRTVELVLPQQVGLADPWGPLHLKSYDAQLLHWPSPRASASWVLRQQSWQGNSRPSVLAWGYSGSA